GRAIAAAKHLGTRYIRLFSFFRGEGVPVESIRDDVMVRMRALAERAEAAGVVLLHENEKDIYGDTPQRCLDIVETVGSPAL
ncbi:TIM barrel protein, partial [Brevibacillus sp. SIMBA_076]